MVKQAQPTQDRLVRKKRLKVEQKTAVGQPVRISRESAVLGTAMQNIGYLDAQAAGLSDAHLQTAQRRALAGYIGQVQGNRGLQRMLSGVETGTIQRMLQRDPDDGEGGGTEAGSTELTLPGSEGTSLGVGSLQLDPGPLQQIPIESTFSPDQLFQPSPELIQQLVDNWVLQYRITHPGPPMEESAWQQLWSAWRRLTDQWLARGADAPLNAQVAQDLLRDQAAQSVLDQQTGGGEVSLADVAGRVWPAFQQALEATQFYTRIRQNAEGLISQHWPALIPLLATALGTSLGMGLQGSDWRAMQQLSTLLPSLSQEVSLGENWSLNLGFAESSPIRGSGEEGVVLGMNPSIGFTYRGEGVQFSVEGSVNLRFETGQESTRGFRVDASPGVGATLRW